MIPGNALEVGQTLCALVLLCLGPQSLHLITVANLHQIVELFKSNLSERLARAMLAQLGYAACPIGRVHDVAVDEEPLGGRVIVLQCGAASSKAPCCGSDVASAQ